jgi:peptidoglycan/LPS O-acetylase OafA/YrhL
MHAGRYKWPVLNLFGNTYNLSALLSLGYIGVEIFFAISGFCLAYPILKAGWGETDWMLYAKRRLLRIVPTYWIAFALLAVTVGEHPRSLRYALEGMFFFNTQVNASFWTLCVEARWYILLPILIWILFRFGWGVLLSLSLVACISSKILFRFDEPVLRWLNDSLGVLPYFLLAFVLGIATAWLFLQQNSGSSIIKTLIRNVRVVTVLAIVVVLIFTPKLPGSDFFPFSRLLPASLLGFSLVLLALFDPFISRVLSWRPLTAIGVASYSIYLIHEPIVHALFAVLHTSIWPQYLQFIFYQFAVLPFCVVVGSGFYLLAERPFVILGQQWLRTTSKQ